jgi:hypothetical protein
MSGRVDVRRRAPAALLLLAAGLTAGGCVAAGFATGPLVSAVQLIGDRSVARTVGAEMDAAWAAVETTLSDMAFRVEGRERGATEWRLRGVADPVSVQATLERVTPRVTRVTVRVETGGVLADRHTAATIHEHIARAVAQATGATAGTPASSSTGDALTSLEAEVRRLRMEMEGRRSSGQPPAEGPAAPPAAVRVQPGAVVTVPLSAAVPSMPGPVPATSLARPVGVMAPIAADIPLVGAAPSGDERPSSSTTGSTAPLRPAEALVPIRPVSAPATGN